MLPFIALLLINQDKHYSSSILLHLLLDFQSSNLTFTELILNTSQSVNYSLLLTMQLFFQPVNNEFLIHRKDVSMTYVFN